LCRESEGEKRKSGCLHRKGKGDQVFAKAFAKKEMGMEVQGALGEGGGKKRGGGKSFLIHSPKRREDASPILMPAGGREPRKKKKKGGGDDAVPFLTKGRKGKTVGLHISFTPARTERDTKRKEREKGRPKPFLPNRKEKKEDEGKRKWILFPGPDTQLEEGGEEIPAISASECVPYVSPAWLK